MAHIAGVDLPREKRVEIGLTYIYGIGVASSKEILAATEIYTLSLHDALPISHAFLWAGPRPQYVPLGYTSSRMCSLEPRVS